MSFTPLRVHSHGSLLCGTASPESLVGAALERGCTALALTDRDNLYLAIRFWQHARSEGLRPLLGALLTSARGEALVLAATRAGFATLCAAITKRRLDGLDVAAALDGVAPGVEVVVEDETLAARLLDGGLPRARLWMGVRGVAAERRVLAARVAAARRLGLRVVATGDVAILDGADHEAHRVAVTAAAGELLDRMPDGAFAQPDAWLAAPAEWERRVRAVFSAAGLDEAVSNAALDANRELSERLRLHLDLGAPIFPRAPLPRGETGLGWLTRLGEAGVLRRYGRSHRAARARLAWELEQIASLGFTDYFLLVAEIVEFTRARGIPSVGRGSGASSLVAYALGITNVDPIRYGLTFERFLNPGRKDCPDLDIDLCWRRRDEVIAHVYETYGHDRVAMISTHATLGARSAFRETAKALGVPNARMNALARHVPHEMDPPYLERVEARPGARGIDWREPVLAQALALAERLSGAPRHLSVHSGGVVIGDRPLTHYVPLERAAKGVVVTQFEMRAIEAVGLVKMDLLGNRALTTIGECVTLASAAGHEVSIEDIGEHDDVTAARVAAGDTLNCFQLESPAMRHLLRMFDARTLDEVIAAVAAVRPGPAEMGLKEAFCRRKRGLEPATYHHPRLEAVLGGTLGVMLYEEDVLHVAAAIAALPLAAGDDLRRAIGHARGEDEFRALEAGFVAHARRTGVDDATAHAVWKDLTRFAAYAFCKAHAAGYGTLGWQSAWLKTRFPAEWAVGILNHHAGMYATWVHVEDLRRHGVTFAPPCAWRSEWDTTLERNGGAPVVRVGLSRVFGLAESTAARIVAERRTRPWASLADLLDRARPTLPEAESLILAGALDGTHLTRPSLLLEARVTLAGVHGRAAERKSVGRSARAGRTSGWLDVDSAATVLPAAVAPVAVAELPEYDVAERVRGEYRSTGLWFTAHPLDVWPRAGALAGAVSAAALERMVGCEVTITGLPCAWRRVETKTSREAMMFLTLADRGGLAECVLFPDAYRRWARALDGAVLRVSGRVGETLGAISLEVRRVEPCG